VEETNRYYEQQSDTLNKVCSPMPNATIQEMYLLLPTGVQMGHGQRDTLKD